MCTKGCALGVLCGRLGGPARIPEQWAQEEWMLARSTGRPDPRTASATRRRMRTRPVIERARCPPSRRASEVPGHLFGAHPGIELLRREQTQLHGGLLECLVLAVRLLGDLRRVVVA